MKKFLSLLLALVMTMSLVTISAGATEYKDLTDKDELGPQYQEAVAVLNKIGVITGYDDGSFRPDVKLTRGAAAKIIVSLLIGPEAANNLPNNYAPYPDVPANHTFAGVISYCKTKGIINGYGDGTFKPANDLTGYAFAKMLLGALGYDATIEKFVDTGWTMNVLNIGQEATLFDRLDFHGSEAVTRKDAALLALNTLKATVVEYKEGLNINVTGENTNVNVTGAQDRQYKTSNQDYARNILPNRRNIDNVNTSRADYNTVEFAEEHFVDLRLPHDKYSPIDDDFGRPSAEWSYKKLSIGKFPLVPDFEYTTQVIHNVNTTTDGAKVRALGLSGYSVSRNTIPAGSTGELTTRLWINGVDEGNFDDTQTITLPDGESFKLDSVADIANFTDNGTLVEVYVDNNGSDFITDVVVVRTQLMEVRRIGSDYVSLDIYDDNSDADGKVLYGYNYIPIDEKVNNVEAEDEYYEFLSGLKAGDKVAVVPVAVDHNRDAYDVAEAYTPETVTGALTGAETYGAVGTKRNAINLTVGGTKYNIALWNKDMYEIDSDSVKVTKKDVTLYLDKYGNTMLATDVGATSDWMVIGNYRQGLVNGIVVTYANGWDIKGNELSLNVGYQHDTNAAGSTWYEQNFPVGSLVHYTNDTTSNTAEWKLEKLGIYNVSEKARDGVTDYTINSSSSRLLLEENKNPGFPTLDPAYQMPFYVNNVPFIYITLDDSGEVDSIEIKKNPQNVNHAEIMGDNVFDYRIRQAEAAISLKDGALKPAADAGIEAVVIKRESSAVSINNLLYISKYHGSVQKDANGNMVQGYEVAMLGEGGKLVDREKVIYSDRTNLRIGSFARYTAETREGFEDFYDLRPFYSDDFTRTAGKSVAVLRANIAKTGVKNAFVGANARMVYLEDDAYLTRATGGYRIESFQKEADTNLLEEVYADKHDSVENLVNVRRAEWLDLTSYHQDIESPTELKDAYKDLVTAGHTDADWHRDIQVTMLFNDDPKSDEFRQVYMVIVNSISTVDVANTAGGSTGPIVTDGLARLATTDTDNAKSVDIVKTEYADKTEIAGVKIVAPDWADVITSGSNAGKDHNSSGVAGAKALTSVRITRVNKDGQPYSGGTVTNTTAWDTDEGCFVATFSSPVDAKDLAEGDYFKIDNVTWTRAKIQYQLNGAVSNLVSDNSGKVSLPIAAAGENLAIKLASAGSVAGEYTLTGIKLDSTVTEADLKVTVANFVGNTTLSGKSYQAAGKGYVVVNVVPGSSQTVTPEYSVTVQANAANIVIPGESTVKATITATPSTVAAGEMVTIKAVLTAASPAANNVESYDVTVKLVDETGKTVDTVVIPGVKNTTGVEKLWKATSNIVIDGANVTFTPNKSKSYIEDVKDVGTNFITIGYVGDASTLIAADIELLRAADGGATPVPPTTIDTTVAGQLTLTFPGAALAEGDVIAVKASKITVSLTALADTETGISLFAASPLTGEQVYVFQITGSGSTKSATVKGKMAYSDAVELVPEAPEAPEAPKPDITVTFALDGVTEWSLPDTKDVTVKAGQEAEITLTQVTAAAAGTDATVAITAKKDSGTSAADVVSGAVTKEGIAKDDTASPPVAGQAAEITVTYAVPAEATDAITITISGVTVTSA